MMTFLETARLIAAADGMPYDAVPLLLRRIRIFDAKDLIPVQRENSGRREGRLDLSGACRARVASELIEFGLNADTLRGLRKSLDRQDIQNKKSEFDTALEQIRTGCPITLAVSLKMENPQTAERAWEKWHSFRLEGLPKFEGSGRAERAQAMLLQPITRAILRVDLTDLLGAFIQAYDNATEA